MSFISFRLFSFLCLTVVATAQRQFEYSICINHTGSYAINGTYRTNISLANYKLFSDLFSNRNIDYGFLSTSYVQNSEQVNIIGLCRGDVEPDVCRSCLYNATIILPQDCPTNKEAWGGYDECNLRYSNRQILHYNDYNTSVYLWNTRNITAPWGRYEPLLRQLLERLKSIAASGDSFRKFAAGDAQVPDFQTIYAVTQCTPDLSKQDCDDCLTRAISEISYCCTNKIGGRVIKPSCNLRYEKTLFYNASFDTVAVTPASPSPAVSLASPPPVLRSIVIIVVTVVASVFLVGIGCYFLRRRSKRNFRTILRETFGNESNTLESLQFSLATIEASTNKFSAENRIGHGGFGQVYKGILPDGREIAVKRLSRTSGQGTIEFKNEILLIAKLQHRNLVALLGFCLHQQEKMLIYEYVPNKSLDHFLFDPNRRRLLNWLERYKIIGAIARGILYLHEHSRLKVIHRDLKPSNVLLDVKMNPKISDFGMARIVDIDQGQGNTNRVVGTYGYMSPEYAMHGQFSEKTDVFSFGVMVLEIISGRKNARDFLSENIDDLLSYSWRRWRANTPLEILDPALRESYNEDEVLKGIQIGLLCVQQDPNDRPMMAKVVLYLNSLTSTELPLPREAAFMYNGMKPNKVAGESSSCQSTNHYVPSSVNDMSISQFYPR